MHPDPSSLADVTIVGGGASGALTAVHLLRGARRPLILRVVEPRQHLGAGVAYSTTSPTHLLNVPAGRMSALPDDPGHFARWSGLDQSAFAPRGTFGSYLQDLVRRSLEAAPAGSRLDHVRRRVIDLEPAATAVVTDDGVRRPTAHIVLATGHSAPDLPAALAGPSVPSHRLVPLPWLPDALTAVRPDETVLCLGTGLTFVDLALELSARVAGVRLIGVSRHGLLPQAHLDDAAAPPPPPVWDAWPPGPGEVVRWVRAHGRDWRSAVDALRPQTAALWRAWDDTSRDAFVRHLARHWDVHRHRMAPGVATVLRRLECLGRVRTLAGTVDEVAPTRRGLRVAVAGHRLDVDRVVVCTGPARRLDQDPLGRTLLRAGRVLEGPRGLGYAAEPASGALLAPDGRPSDTVSALGPPLHGELWESVAIPEIAVQARWLATRLLPHLDRAGAPR